VFSWVEKNTRIDRNGVDKESTHLRRLLIDSEVAKRTGRRRVASS
jgi:hypothetical protein